jgi:hypothetical protein
VFPVWYELYFIYYVEEIQSLKSHVEAGSNISTVALRAIEGDEKGTQCLGDINTGTWPKRLGESRI